MYIYIYIYIYIYNTYMYDFRVEIFFMSQGVFITMMDTD